VGDDAKGRDQTLGLHALGISSLKPGARWEPRQKGYIKAGGEKFKGELHKLTEVSIVKFKGGEVDLLCNGFQEYDAKLFQRAHIRK